MTTYKALKNQSLSIEEFKIVPIRYQDRFLIMRWRNEQMYHLRQSKKLTKANQENYFSFNIQGNYSEKNPSEILFSFLKNESCIGYGGLVHIDWQNYRCEMSFLASTSAKKNSSTYRQYFKNFIHLIQTVCFQDLQMNKLYTETYSFRTKHIKILEESNFVSEGSMRDHIFLKEDGAFFDSKIHSILKKDYEK